MASFAADIGAGFGISVPGLRFTIDGRFLGGIDAGLADLTDGAVDGLAHVGNLAFPCLFHPITGALTAGDRMTFKVGISIFSFKYHFNIAEFTIADFEIGCTGSQGHDTPIVDDDDPATLTSSTLAFNVSDHADQRDLPAGLGDGVTDEVYAATYMTPSQPGASPGDPAYDPNALQANAFGVAELFYGPEVALIQPDGGDGFDAFTIAQEIDVDAYFTAAAANANDVIFVTQGGDETVYAGTGNVVIRSRN